MLCHLGREVQDARCKVQDAEMAALAQSVPGQRLGASGLECSGGLQSSGQRLVAAQSGASTEPSEG